MPNQPQRGPPALCGASSRGSGCAGPGAAAIAAIGPGTARALAEQGIAADLVAERFVAESLIESLAAVEVEGRRVLFAAAAEAREVLPEALRQRGAEVDVISLYETVREDPDPEALEAARGADYVTFTSASTVDGFLAAFGEDPPPRARLISIGPITSEALRSAGLEVAAQAERHDIEGLVQALLDDAKR